MHGEAVVSVFVTNGGFSGFTAVDSAVAEAAGIGLVSNAAHPGCALTNLQKSGPGPKAKWVAAIEKIMASLMSQDAAHGALPTLRAATTMDAAQGSYYTPDRMFGLKGDPILVPVPKPARGEVVARRLWKISPRLTGVSFAGIG